MSGTSNHEQRIRARHNYTLDDRMVDALRDYCERTGSPASRVVEEAVMRHIRAESGERSPLAPSEGTWSAFAEKVVRERDEAIATIAALRERLDEATAKIDRMKGERDEALAERSKAREILSRYYWECECQHEAMDSINIEAYQIMQEENKP